MSKKLLVTIGLALIAASVTSIAAEQSLKLAPEPKSETGPTFQFQSFAVLQTQDLDRGEGGVGISGVLNLTDYLGVEVEGYSFGTEGLLVDRAGASLRYNILTRTKSRPYLFGGAWYNLEDQDSYGFHAGLGIAHQFAKFFTPFADVRFHKPLNGEDTATSCVARAGLSLGF